MKTDLGRVRGLLTEAITMLCKSSLAYNVEFSVEGLLGITLDNSEVFLININEKVKEIKMAATKRSSEGSPNASKVTPSNKKRRKLSGSGDQGPISPESHHSNNSSATVISDNGESNQNMTETRDTNEQQLPESSIKTEPDAMNNVVQSVDFGDILATYDGGDTLDTDSKLNLQSELDAVQTNIANQPTDDEDIVVVKEEFSEAAAQRLKPALPPPTASNHEQLGGYYPEQYENQDYTNQSYQQFPDMLTAQVGSGPVAGTSFEEWQSPPTSTPIKSRIKTSQKPRTSMGRGASKTNSNQGLTPKPGLVGSRGGKPSNGGKVKMTMSKRSLMLNQGDGESEMLISFACKFCGSAFSDRSKLRQHINGMHKQPKYECDGCGKRFQWSSSHFYHKKQCPQFLQLGSSAGNPDVATSSQSFPVASDLQPNFYPMSQNNPNFQPPFM